MKLRGLVISRGALLCMVLLSAVAVSSCGRKGAPHPPEESAPGAVLNLVAKGAVNGMGLYWQAPRENAAGEVVANIGSFVVQRRDVIGKETNRFEDVGILELDPEAVANLRKKQFTFLDESAVVGRRYDYIVFARTDDGLDGESNVRLRTTFRGESSVVETLLAEENTR